FRTRLIEFRGHLEGEKFLPSTIQHYLESACCFLVYLVRKKKQPEKAIPEDIDAFLEGALRSFRKVYRRSPMDVSDWRWRYTAAIHRMLRGIQGQWPPRSTVDDRPAEFQAHLDEQEFCRDYRDLHRH